MAVNKVTPSSPRIQSLLLDVENGNIKIPVFQRRFVWDDAQILGLLDSIYQGYPVGSILMWQSKDSLKSERNVGSFVLPDSPDDYPVKYVLDGQQRLTTLYGVFHSADDTVNAELAARFNICFVPATYSFVPQAAASHNPSLNLRDVLDATRLLKELPRFSQSEQETIAGLQERFKDYEFPVVTIKNRTNQEVCRIFQRINSSGTQLSTIELLTAWTWSENFDLQARIQRTLNALSDKGFGSLDDQYILRSLAARLAGDLNVEALVDADPDDLVRAMDDVERASATMVDFLVGEFKIRNSIFIPFPLMLIPLTAFFTDCPKPNAVQRLMLRKWFWHAAFTLRFQAGTTKAVLADLQWVKKLVEDPDNTTAPTGTVDPVLFRKTWRINSTAAKATICMLGQLEPQSLLSGARINLDHVLNAYNNREFHHIYPKAYLLNTHGVPFEKVNQIANICMLTASDNKLVSDRAPHEYYKDIDPEIMDAALASALLVKSDFDVATKYENFIARRTEALADRAQQLINTGY